MQEIETKIESFSCISQPTRLTCRLLEPCWAFCLAIFLPIFHANEKRFKRKLFSPQTHAYTYNNKKIAIFDVQLPKSRGSL